MFVYILLTIYSYKLVNTFWLMAVTPETRNVDLRHRQDQGEFLCWGPTISFQPPAHNQHCQLIITITIIIIIIWRPIAVVMSLRWLVLKSASSFWTSTLATYFREQCQNWHYVHSNPLQYSASHANRLTPNTQTVHALSFMQWLTSLALQSCYHG